MKKFAALFMILTLCSGLFLFTSCDEDNTETESCDIKIMSYNVRVYSPFYDIGQLDLYKRYPRIKERIEGIDPDIICMQEFTAKHQELFDADFTDTYDYVLTYRSDSSVTIAFHEAEPIFYKKDKFELLDSGTFWLSETPDEMTIGWDAGYYRICTWAKLKVKSSGKEFYVYNTHFDFGEVSTPSSITLLFERMELDYPCLLTGDFNLTPATEYYRTLTSNLSDCRLTATQSSMPDSGTTNSYSEEVSTKVIDFIFFTPGDFTVYDHAVHNNDYATWGTFASDHYAVSATMDFANG